MIKDGQKIVFLGDSITAAPEGYVKVVENMIAALAPDIRVECINAGVSGNKVGDLLERIGDDAIVHDPDWITVSIGINDVWHGVNGTPIELFRQRYDELVRRLAEQTVARLALFTTTVIGEDLESQANRLLVPYNDFIRETAVRRKALLVPMNEQFHRAIAARQKVAGVDLHFTTDGVHMNPAGNCLMAVTLLRAWGLM
ncbi:MAG: SGNH/GDSL hydrolase family protein [Armatimonadota bacterium]